MPYNIVPRTAASDIKTWITFNEFGPRVNKGVGLVALRRSAILKGVEAIRKDDEDDPRVQLGIVRPLGKAVVFGAMLPYMLEDALNSPDGPEDVSFGVRMVGTQPLRLVPALRLPDRSVHILDGALEEWHERSFYDVPPHTPVY